MKERKKKKIRFFFFKNTKFVKRIFFQTKNAILLVSNIRNTGFNQSSPVQPASEYRGGSTSVTHGQTEGNPRVLVQDYQQGYPVQFWLVSIVLASCYLMDMLQTCCSTNSIQYQTQGFPDSFVLLCPIRVPPPCILKRTGLESSGQIAYS